MSFVNCDDVVENPHKWPFGEDVSSYEDDLFAWHNAMEFELTTLMSQPRTNENIQQIGEMLDWYLFRHLDHEILIERVGEQDINIHLFMLYENIDDVFVDFELLVEKDDMIDHQGDNFHQSLQDLIDMARLDGVDLSGMEVPSKDQDLLEDAYWAIAHQVAERADQELLRALVETKSELDVVKVSAAEPEISNQSVDDMLFEPISLEQTPPPPPAQPPVRDDSCCDPATGCYC